MTQEKKNKILSAAVSVGIHLILIIILSFLTLKYVQEDEDGIPVMFGEVPEAGGDSAGELLASNKTEQEASVEESPAPSKPESVPEPTPTKEPLMTQDDEPSVSAAEQERKAEEERKRQEELRKAEERRKAEEARIAEERRKAEEAERKRKEEEERKRREAAERANSKVAGAFGSAKANGSNGQTQGEGLQGSTEGNANQGTTTGVGGTGSNPVAKVGSRKPVYTPKPVYVDPKGSGTVVVEITVNRSGKVTNARIKSTTATEALNREALNKARISTFSTGANDAEVGTITYNFKLT